MKINLEKAHGRYSSRRFKHLDDKEVKLVPNKAKWWTTKQIDGPTIIMLQSPGSGRHCRWIEVCAVPSIVQSPATECHCKRPKRCKCGWVAKASERHWPRQRWAFAVRATNCPFWWWQWYLYTRKRSGWWSRWTAPWRTPAGSNRSTRWFAWCICKSIGNYVAIFSCTNRWLLRCPAASVGPRVLRHGPDTRTSSTPSNWGRQIRWRYSTSLFCPKWHPHPPIQYGGGWCYLRKRWWDPFPE